MLLSCPGCSRILEAPDDAAHAAGQCPRCGLRLRVPGQTELAQTYEHDQETSEVILESSLQ